jgi:glutamine synthetase
MKDGRNMMLDASGKLSDDARRMIAGLIDLAPSITAFGNTNPTSYFRLVPHQEAPTNICWGDRNRSVLIRVPLGWTAGRDMSSQVNPLEKSVQTDTSSKQTVEIRSADGSADVYRLMAALAVAARHGFRMPDALKVAEDTYVDVNIHSEQHRSRTETLAQLPASCADSAVELARQRDVYQQDGIFEPRIIDSTIADLTAFADSDIRAQVKARPELMGELVDVYFHCG